MDGLAAMRSAIAMVSSITLSCGTTLFTSPSSAASFASQRRPVKISSFAFWMPTRRGSRWHAPPPGKNPCVVSGNEKIARSEAMLMSHWSTSSKPPAMQ